MTRLALALALSLILTGCTVTTTPLLVEPGDPEPTPTFAPISLIVTPTPFWSVAPLPTAEAARIFKYPTNGKPSLLFVYDDAAT